MVVQLGAICSFTSALAPTNKDTNSAEPCPNIMDRCKAHLQSGEGLRARISRAALTLPAVAATRKASKPRPSLSKTLAPASHKTRMPTTLSATDAAVRLVVDACADFACTFALASISNFMAVLWTLIAHI